MSMYPTSNGNNVNVQQIPSQPLYDPPVYAQSALNQPCPSQCCGWSSYNGYPQEVANPVTQPMMWSLIHCGVPLYNGAQYAQQQQQLSGYSNAPVDNGQSVNEHPVPTYLRAPNASQLPPLAIASKELADETQRLANKLTELRLKESAPEELPIKTQEFLKALDKAQQAKSSSSRNSSSQTVPENELSSSGMNGATIQKYFEQQMSLQKQILDLLQPKPSDAYWRPSQPKSYELAMERFKAMDSEEPKAPEFAARKNASMVFIYDLDDITQLTLKVTKGVKRLFPELINVTKSIENAFHFLARKFFEHNEDYDYNVMAMNVTDGDFGGKVKQYLEFKNKLEASGPNIILELIKAYEEDMKALGASGKPMPNVDLFHAVRFQKLFDQHWQSAKKCLQAITDKSLKNTYDNVVLCDMIGTGATQLLMSGLASDVPLENLYSSYMSSKEQVLERIQRHYGDDCVLVLVTSNPKTIAAAEKKNMSVWEVDSVESLDVFQTAQPHLLE